MMEPSQLLTKLLDYVIEQSKDIDPRGFNLGAAKGFFRTGHELKGLPGIELDVRLEGDHVWLRVERLEAHPAPTLLRPAPLVIDLDPNGKPPSIDEAALQARVSAAGVNRPLAEIATMEEQERAYAAGALAEYSPFWLAWADVEKPRRKTITLYAELFTVKQQLELEDTAKPSELVCGIGVASWELQLEERAKSSSIDYLYPVITQTVELAIDDDSLAIELRPRAVGPRIEFDAFAACQMASAAAVERVAKEELTKTAERPVSPFDVASYEHVLRHIAGNLDLDGRYVTGQSTLPAVTPTLLVTDLWVLHSRARSNNFLIEDIECLKARLVEGAEIPEGPLALVTPPADEQIAYTGVSFRGLSGTTGSGGAPRELFFPLPYNHEQVTIVEQLERSTGVAVQGPPGTGKTHTIANVICHYLANGKKILVTSKGEKALEVLREKIPVEVRPLTVALLAGDREGLRQFQTSIEAIIAQVSQLNPEIVTAQIETGRSAIDRAHTELASIDRRVDEIAMTQLSDVEVDGVVMRAQKMAELVVQGGEAYGWFDDALSLDPAHAPPLDGVESSRLREVRRRLGKDLTYVGAKLPSSVGLPPADDIVKLHEMLRDIAELAEAEAAGELLALRSTSAEVLSSAREMLSEVEIALGVLREIEASTESWPLDLRQKCRLADYASERGALEALFSEIDALIVSRAAFLQRPVEMSEAAFSSAKVKEAILRASKTGKPFGLVAFGVGDAKEHVATIRVAGLAPADLAAWQHVAAYLKLHEQVLSFSVRWNQFAETLSVPTVSGGVTGLRRTELLAISARRAYNLAVKHDARLPGLADATFARPPLQQLRGSASDLELIRDQLRRHLTRAELADSTRRLAILQEKVGGTTGPVSDNLRRFIVEILASANPTEQVVATYVDLVAEVRRIEALWPELGALSELTQKIEQGGAPLLSGRLRTVPVQPAGEDAVWPTSWREAWNWSRVKSYLEGIEARDELLTLGARRRSLEAGLAKLYTTLVSQSAWLATKRGASPKVLSALETYRTAVNRIGAGTGPNAVRHRRDAQKAMRDAQGAVPCWVMSHAKVSETLPATLGSFDLVIVDEASQSDLWALPPILRGKKILVVGDDKQVSPDGGFVSSVRIQELKDRFLSEQPYAAILTPEKSLFDIASTVFAAQKVMLREHFRCVPAIIGYSNRTFYKDAIQPLRIAKLSERIDPPLVDIYVPEGRRDKRDINRAEAEAIVAEIQALQADPAFVGRTIGVVTLLGPEQAKFIDALARERCDAADLLHRKFACGDARTFQGGERHIMFLSLVVDPSSTKALTDTASEQRFNVAASRAQDRMYLVRSVKQSDLSPSGKDLRTGLLQHFSKPLDGQGDGGDAKSLVDLCESGFEKQVYRALFERGYRVIPQVKAGAFRIDMVVEGENDARLAIELDGDEFHGPDRWQADMSRQRVLERAGWTFWRCFASTWSLRKDEVLQELLERLTAMGIEPLGAVERIPSLVEYREWRTGATDEDAKAARALDDALTLQR